MKQQYDTATRAEMIRSTGGRADFQALQKFTRSRRKTQ
jgi:hypothetical protein